MDWTTIKNRLRRLIYPDGTTPLPTAVVSALYIALVFNAMTNTMVFAYLPGMMKSFGISEVDVGKSAGIVASSGFVGRVIACYFWGWLADTKGKKLATLITCVLGGVTSIAFGFSTSLTWALLSRLSQGLVSGMVVAGKAIINDICDETNQAVGMAIILASDPLGLIIGPSIGGFLEQPAVQYPDTFSEDSIFAQFAYLLPNMLLGIGFLVIAAILFFVLPSDRACCAQPNPESLVLVGPSRFEPAYRMPSCVPNLDYLELSFVRNSYERAKHKPASCKHEFVKISSDDENFWQQQTSGSWRGFVKCLMNSPILELLRNKDCMLATGLYFVYALPGIGIYEIFSVWAATDSEYHGLNFSPRQIGLALLIIACLEVLAVPSVIARLTHKYGAKKMMISTCFAFVLFCPLLPTLDRVQQHKGLFWFLLIIFLFATVVSTLVGFLAINIFVSNSVPSRLIGSANGFATACCAVGRVVTPTLLGTVFSWSLQNVKTSTHNGIGYPLNQHLAFYVMSIAMVFIVGLTTLIPNYLDTKRSEEELENGPISCGYTGPTSTNNNRNEDGSHILVTIGVFQYGSISRES